ncbi:MAG: hypothetical protein J3Q66DRAFT_369331 [Benniella sp.]|nr:MAG: hypothetical protein J3Q66DRAFT_369331 [Benniella sp.]
MFGIFQGFSIALDELPDEDFGDVQVKRDRQKDKNSARDTPQSEPQDHQVLHLFGMLTVDPLGSFGLAFPFSLASIAEVLSSSSGVSPVPAPVTPKSSVLVPALSSSGSASSALKSSAPVSSGSGSVDDPYDPSQTLEIRATGPYIAEFKRMLLATEEKIADVCNRPDVVFEAVRLFEQQEFDAAVNGFLKASGLSEKSIVDPVNASVQTKPPTALEEPTVGPVTAVQQAKPPTSGRALSVIAKNDEDMDEGDKEDEECLVRTHYPRAAQSGLERDDNGKGIDGSGRSDIGRRGASKRSVLSVSDDEDGEGDNDHGLRSSPEPGSISYRTTEVMAALGREHSSLMWEKLGRVLDVYETDLTEESRRASGEGHRCEVSWESEDLEPKKRKTTWLEQ